MKRMSVLIQLIHIQNIWMTKDNRHEPGKTGWPRLTALPTIPSPVRGLLRPVRRNDRSPTDSACA